MLYPDRSYEEHRRFLGSVAASPPSGLDGFRRHGSGIALTFFVESDLGPDFARQLAVQRAAGLWPNYRPAETAVRTSPG